MKFLRMFAQCIIVKGAVRSIVCDLQRGTYEFIPKTLSHFMKETSVKPIDNIIEDYNLDQKEMAISYVNFLIDREYAFLTANPEYYPELGTEYKNTMLIDNAIIDWDKDSNYNYPKLVAQLELLNCQNVELRFFDVISLVHLQKLLSCFEKGPIRSIEIFLKYEILDDYTSNLVQLISENPRISFICLHSVPNQLLSNINNVPRLLLTSEVIKDESHCGIVNPNFFSVNQNLFLESLKYNNCLNAKIAVDRKGKIKNCPSMKFDFGDIDFVELRTVVETDSFQKLWGINKDKVEICKDCEFRYICPDCRAYTEGNGRFTKPEKCSYNPYEGKWEGSVF